MAIYFRKPIMPKKVVPVFKYFMFLFIYCYKPVANQRIITVIYYISMYCNGYL